MAKWTSRKRRESDTVIAEGVVSTEIPPNVMETTPIPVGAKLKFARIIRTPIGRTMRIFNTKRWVPESSIDCKFDSKLVYDYTGLNPDESVPPEWSKTKKELVLSQKLTAKKPKKTRAKRKKLEKNSDNQFKKRIRFVITNSEVRVRTRLGAIGMDKSELKNVITTLTPGDAIKVAFLGPKADLTGDFEVVATRRGRGKGGSQLVELRTSTGETLVTGTPESENVLHIVTADGVLHGFETPSDVPPVFETDAGAAALLKEKFATLLDADGQYKVRVASTHEPFNGTFVVRSAVQKRGRHGQVVLSLSRDATSDTFELWSHRHSLVVNSFEVDPTA